MGVGIGLKSRYIIFMGQNHIFIFLYWLPWKPEFQNNLKRFPNVSLVFDQVNSLTQPSYLVANYDQMEESRFLRKL